MDGWSFDTELRTHHRRLIGLRKKTVEQQDYLFPDKIYYLYVIYY